MSIVRGEVLHHGVRTVERVMVTDLLTSGGELPTNGSVVGAVGVDIRIGSFYVLKQKRRLLLLAQQIRFALQCVCRSLVEMERPWNLESAVK